MHSELTYHGVVYVGRDYNKTHQNGKRSVKGYIREHRPQIIIFGGCNVKKGWTSNLSPTTKMYRLYLDDNDHDNDALNINQYEEDGKYQQSDINNNDNNQNGNKWKHIANLPVAVQNFAYLCVLNNFIIIFGGDLGELKCSRNIYLYNIEKRTWKLLGIKLPDHLYGMTAIESKNNVIHLFGGHNGKSKQRLHLSIKTSKLLAKEFDEFDSSFTWKQLSRSGNQDLNDDVSLIDELKRVKRKLKDLEEKYSLQQLQYQHIMEENQEIKRTNISLLDKVAQAMQEKEDMQYEIHEIKKHSQHHHHHGRHKKRDKLRDKEKSLSKSPSIKSRSRPSTPKSSNKPSTPRSHSKSRKKKKHKHHKAKSEFDNVDIELLNELKLSNREKTNFDPKYIMFRNFLYGRIGLPQYLNEFQSARLGDICKIIDLNDQSLKLKVGISNDLHRKLILKVINEFKLEILQFKSWISSYDEQECNLKQYLKPFAKYGIITWHLLAQHISNKKDFKTKLFVESDIAIDCFYQHLQQFLNGIIPQPNPKKIKINHINHNSNDNDNIIDINNRHDTNDENSVLFDDSGYHNW